MNQIYKLLALSLIAACTATSAWGSINLFGGNTSGRVFTVDDLTDGSTSTEISPNSGYNVAGLAWVADDATLYGINDSTFFTIDPDSGVKDLIKSGTSYNGNDLAYDSSTNTLYGANHTRFYSIDLADGAMTSIRYNLSYTNLNAMAYDASTDTLFGGNASGDFFSIDRSDGTYTIIGSSGFDVQGMAFDPTTNTLYAGNNSNRFFTINVSNGVMTDLGGDTGATEFNIEALAFVPEPSLTSLLMGLSIFALIACRRNRVRS